ncbi:hypothetical protein RY831_27695 [Noviherbaspirillum sp. CPCC 100848]|uniref:Uncharacterized protein n=1 Tax=Noviherbaspirillum album TaxID=3080276 RepID=A0ABU6JH04_9BURK|nr:hypothetical protein [Noviherbaspirillum sp. CPCC 100848]MEC4722948.1 hypothetical protein [Noviherbaspirillum sp. CPCC 100848]
MGESQELEREAIALWKEYKIFLNRPKPKAFLLRLAAFLQWQELHKELAK